MSVPASVPKRSARHLLRRFGQSGIRNWESYSSNSTTSPFFRAVEIRLADDPERMGPGKLEGVLMPYETRAADRPEVFEAGSLHWPDDGVLLRSMHRREMPIARFTPKASATEVRVSIQLPDTTAGRDAAANVRAGVLRGLSVEFTSERETRRDGLRVIQKARLVGAGLVDSGAYEAATVEARHKAGRRRRLWL